MILLDGNVFIAEVKYDKIANSITLVKGHTGHLMANLHGKVTE